MNKDSMKKFEEAICTMKMPVRYTYEVMRKARLVQEREEVLEEIGRKQESNRRFLVGCLLFFIGMWGVISAIEANLVFACVGGVVCTYIGFRNMEAAK